MKIGILTHYKASSHGALLQMYGLQQVLKEMGHDVYIVTYSTNMDFVDEDTRKRFSASYRNIPYYLKNYMIKNGPSMLLFQYKKQHVLSKFRDDHFKMISYTESQKLDCVVVGADEVFAIENGVDPVKYGHGIVSPKIIAYAPSCGQTDVTRIEKYGCKELIQSGLKKFTALSARDEGTQNVIKELTGIDAPIVCDPALLYSYEHPKKEKKKKYIVVYSYQSNFNEKERIRKIKELAKEKNCELWSVGVYYKWCDKKINCNPLEMVKIFADAECIITDTFHGTITSYIAHTPVAVFVRKNNNVKLDHLLGLIGIRDRKVDDLDKLKEVIDEKVDFDTLDKNVELLRKAGCDYLQSSLDE